MSSWKAGEKKVARRILNLPQAVSVLPQRGLQMKPNGTSLQRENVFYAALWATFIPHLCWIPTLGWIWVYLWKSKNTVPWELFTFSCLLALLLSLLLFKGFWFYPTNTQPCKLNSVCPSKKQFCYCFNRFGLMFSITITLHVEINLTKISPSTEIMTTLSKPLKYNCAVDRR